jgi:hypothetical protein
MIDTFVQPVATWSPTRSIAQKPQSPAVSCKQASWDVLAWQGEWESAIVGHLAANRGRVELWRLVNEIAVEALPECRWMLRENKTEILAAIKAMIHEGRVRRFRKRWLISREVDDSHVIPLEEFRHLRTPGT